MPYPERPEAGNDDQFAQALAERHQQMLARVQAALPVLDLIEQVKRDLRDQNLVGRDTVAEPLAAAGTVPGTAQIERLDAQSPALPEVTRIGRFELVRQIGSGGYGIVWQARDPQLGRDVAIKIPRIESALSSEASQRFEREAAAAAALNHSRIVPVFEFGAAQGVHYLVSPLIDGENLGTLLARGIRVSPSKAAEMVMALADALEHAHQRGILHRDLKPANILIERNADGTYDDATIVAGRITDFGLAALLNNDQALTRSQAVVGTPAFMAPEQATGDRRRVQPTTDVYGLGALLYTLLTGEAPFQRPTMLETVRAITHSEPIPPRTLNPHVDRDLQAICLRCLEKEPAHRYATARELQLDLQRYLDGRPVHARPVSRWQRMRRWAGRNPLLASTGVAAVIFLATALIATSVGWISTSRALRRENVANQAAATRLQQLQLKSAQLTQAIEQFFVSVATSEEIRGESAEGLRQTLLTEANRFYRDFLAEAPEDDELRRDYAWSLLRLAEINELLGELASAEQLARNAIDELLKLPDDSNRAVTLSEWNMLLARCLTKQGRFRQAKDELDRALSWLDHPASTSAFVESLPLRAKIHSYQADSLLSAGNIDEARSIAESSELAWQAFDAAAEPHGAADDDPLARALTQFVLAETLQMRGEFEAAEEKYDAAVALFELARVHSHDAPGIVFHAARCLRGRGIACALQQNFDRARASYMAALEFLDPLVDQHPRIEVMGRLASSIRYSLAATEMSVKDYAAVEQIVGRNVETLKQLLDAFPETAATSHSSLGDNYNLLHVAYMNWDERGQLDAEEILHKSIDHFQSAIDADPNWTRPQMALARAENNMAGLLIERGDAADALDWNQSAFDRNQSLLAAEPNWFEAHHSQCHVLATFSRIHTARADYERALEYCDELIEFGPKYSELPKARLEKAVLLGRLHRFDAAASELESFCDVHAKTPENFIAAAEAAVAISQLPDGPDFRPLRERFEELAIASLRKGQPEEPEKRREFLEQVEQHLQLAALRPRL